MARQTEVGIKVTAITTGLQKGVKTASKSLKGLRKSLELTGKGVEGFGSTYRAGVDVIFKSVEIFKSIQGLLADTVGKFIEASIKFRREGTDPQLKAIKRFKREAETTLGAFGDIFVAMYAGIADALGPSIKSLRTFIKANRELVGTKTVEFLAEVANTLLDVLGPAIGISYRIFSGFKMIVSLTGANLQVFAVQLDKVKRGFTLLKGGLIVNEIKAQNSEIQSLIKSYRKVEKAQGAESGRAKTLQKEILALIDARDKNKKKLQEIEKQEKAQALAIEEGEKAADKARAQASREILEQEKKMKKLEEIIKRVRSAIGKGLTKIVEATMKRLREEIQSYATTQEEADKKKEEADKKRAEAAKKAVELAKRRHDEEMKRLEAERAMQAQLGGIIGSQVAGSIKSVAQGTKSASEAMKDFAIQTAQAVIKATILAGIQTAVKAGTMSAFGGGLFSSLAGGLLSFNNGGYVPGFNSGGGVDSVAARLTPGEFVLPKGIVDSIRLGKAPPKAAYANGGMVQAGAQLPGNQPVNIQMQTFAVPTRGQFRRWYKSSVSPNVASLRQRGQV